MIKSILDTDLYKLTQQQAVIQEFPDTIVRYDLIIRTPRNFRDGFIEELRDQINKMKDLQLTDREYKFLLRKTYFFKRPYLDFLKGYRFDPNEVTLQQNSDGITLQIIGPWYRTILWETPLMATISELFFKNSNAWEEEKRKKVMVDKACFFNDIGAKFADFGTRRRYNFDNHNLLVKTCKEYANTFTGTSNPYLAMVHDTNTIGTQAHEWFMAIAALYGYPSANKIGLEKWVDVYQGDLGIALTDTFTSNIFFSNFNTKYAKLFDGIRHDSGDPVEFAKKTIRHYDKLKIDPKSKTIVFSDGLDKNAVAKIKGFCEGKIKDSYGIGTNLTNDVGLKPLNIVIKLTAVLNDDQWIPTVKLSDNTGKHTGPVDSIRLCKQTLQIKE